MGFWSKLGAIWSNPLTTKSYTQVFDEGKAAVRDGGRSLWAGLYNTIGALHGDDDNNAQWHKALQGYSQFGADAMALNQSWAEMGQKIPVTKQLNQAAQSLLYVGNETVRRPLGAAGLVLGDDLAGKDRAWTHQNGMGEIEGLADVWRTAYNDTETASTGQAWTYAAEQSPLPRLSDKLHGRPVEAVHDPRTAEGQAYFHKSWSKQQLTSGGIDIAAAMYADPAVGALKAAKAAKLTYISKPVRAASIGSVADDMAYVNHRNTDRLFDLYRNSGKTEDQLHQEVFHGTPMGGMRNGVLTNAARLEDPARARQVFNDALLAQKGDPLAQQRMITAVPDMARSIINKQIGVHRAELARRYGEGVAADAAIDALRTTEIDSMVSAAANGRGIYGQTFGSGINQYTPRVSLTSKWRVGMHQIFNGDPAYLLAPEDSVGRQVAAATGALRKFTPSATTTRVISFDDANITHLVRANWEYPRVLSVQQLSDLTTRYGRASTANSRSLIFEDAEQQIAAAIAKRQGYTDEEFQAVLPTLRNHRAVANAGFTTSQQYMSEPVRKMADDILDRGDELTAQRTTQLADEMDEAAARGDQPRRSMSIVDSDGNTVIYPDGWEVGKKPVLTSQQRPMAPMVDWRVFEHALKYNREGPMTFTRKLVSPGVMAKVRQRGYTVYDHTVTAADAITKAWKVSVLARPAAMWRGPSDELARNVAYMGMANALQHSLPGVRDNARTRLAAGAQLLADKVEAARTRRAMDSHDVAEVKATDVSTPTAPLAETIGGAQHYSTIESQLADGLIPVRAYMDHVLHIADNQPGELNPDLASMVQAFRDGDMPAKEFKRHAVEHALAQHGRNSYVMPDWREGVLGEIKARHGNRPTGAARRAVVIDPFSGMSPQSQVLADYKLSANQMLNSTDEAAHLEQWIIDHHDALLKPNATMYGVVSASGKIHVSVATARDVAAVVKPTGGQRFDIQRLADWMKPGSRGLTIPTTNGPVHLDSWSEGGMGAHFKAHVSARGVDGQSWADRVTDKTYAELVNATRRSWDDAHPGQDKYAVSWERAVNTQLANDQVVRMFMGATKNGERATMDDVLRWLYDTPEGQAYYERMGAQQARAVDFVQVKKAMLDYTLPHDGSAHADVMYRKALDHEVAHADLEKLIPEVTDRPVVHGGALDLAVGNKFATKFNKAVNGLFAILQDMPADHFARYPMAKEAYQRHATELYQTLSKQYDKSGLEFVPTAHLEQIRSMAMDRARMDVRKYLYDAATTHDLAKIGRVAVPFGSAAADSYAKWSRIFKEKPWTAYELWKVWQAPDNAGLITDENGFHKKMVNGRAQWFSVDENGKATRVPDHDPRDTRVTMQLPSGMQPSQMPGAKQQATMSFNKNTLNTMLNNPSAGLFVSVPMNQFVLSHPEFAENKFIKTFVLPFGGQADWKAMVVPGWSRTLSQFLTGQEGDAAQSQAVAIMQTELVRKAQGLRDTYPTYAEAREKSNQLRGIRFLYQFGGLTPQFNSPFAPLVDQYHQLKAGEQARQAKDPNYTADIDFYEQHGQELYYLTMAVTRNQKGVPSTVGGQRAYGKWQKLIDANPDIGGWIIGKDGAGAFSTTVYQNQLNQALGPGSTEKMRKRLGTKESTEDAAISLGWIKWNKVSDAIDNDLRSRGLSNINQRGAEDLKAARNRYLQANMWWDQAPEGGGRQINPWYQDYSTRDASKMTNRLNQFANAIKDPNLAQRDEAQGVAKYLQGRQRMKQIMADQGFATLNSKKAAGLNDRWQEFVQGLKLDNLSFATTYNRYLTSDQYLDAPFEAAE